MKFENRQIWSCQFEHQSESSKLYVLHARLEFVQCYIQPVDLGEASVKQKIDFMYISLAHDALEISVGALLDTTSETEEFWQERSKHCEGRKDLQFPIPDSVQEVVKVIRSGSCSI